MQVPTRSLIRLMLSLTVSVFLFLLVTGCSSSPLRCHDSMLRENSMKKIALFSEGGVIWLGQLETHLDASESLNALKAVHDETEAELKQKGYELVASLPARVYNFNFQNVHQYWPAYDIHQNYVIYENYRDDRHKKRELEADMLVFEAPELKENEALSGAVNKILTDIELATVLEEVEAPRSSATSGLEAKPKTYISHLNAFNPAPEDVAVIRESIDADTICFAKAYERLVTVSRGNFKLALGPPEFQHTAVLQICIDSGTGDVLWQRFTRKQKKPYKESIAEIVRKNLSRFPERGKPVTGECKL